MADSAFVVTLNAGNFRQVVIEGSFQRPVLVDFWADWCAPCRALMPVLAKLAEAYDGKFLLGKLDTEAERDLAAQFGIRSLPTVQLFKGGKPVDQFMGALPEAQVRAFLDRHLPREADLLVARAEALIGTGNLIDAAALIAQARASEPNHPKARSPRSASGPPEGTPREPKPSSTHSPWISWATRMWWPSGVTCASRTP